jgi:hypothetical protein
MLYGIYIALYGTIRSLRIMYGVSDCGTTYCQRENHYVKIILTGTKSECEKAIPALKEKYNIK